MSSLNPESTGASGLWMYDPMQRHTGRLASQIDVHGLFNPSVFLLLTALCAFWCMFFLLRLTPHPDNAWLLEISRRMLNGGVYGRDFIEVNPPLIAWLMMPVVALSAKFNIPEYNLFAFYIAALIWTSMSCVYVLLDRSVYFIRMGRALLVCALCVWAFICADSNFGQREQIAVTLYLPFIVAFGLSNGDLKFDRLNVAVAAMACIGFLIKPHFMIIPVLLYLMRAYRIRSLKPDPFLGATFCVGGAYALFLLNLDGYDVFSYQKYYRQFGARWDLGLLEEYWVDGALFILSLACMRLLTVPADVTFLLRSIALAAAGAFAAFVIQQKGWHYHFIPFRILNAAFIGLLLYAALLRGLARHGAHSASAMAGTALCIFMLLPASQTLLRREDPSRVESMERLRRALIVANAGSEVVFFSRFLDVQYPLNLVYRLSPIWPYAHLWLLPSIESLRAQGVISAEAAERETQIATRDVLDRLRKKPPHAIVAEFDTSRPNLGTSDFMALFRAEPEFADFLRSYERKSIVDGERSGSRYEIYVKPAIDGNQ